MTGTATGAMAKRGGRTTVIGGGTMVALGIRTGTTTGTVTGTVMEGRGRGRGPPEGPRSNQMAPDTLVPTSAEQHGIYRAIVTNVMDFGAFCELQVTA